MRFQRFFKKTALILSCVLMACSFISCKGVEITGKTEEVDGYTEAQAMVIIGSERNRYQNQLGGEVWSLPVENQ